MIRVSWNSVRENATGRAALGVVLLFAYGGVVASLGFRIVAFSGLALAGFLQTTALPVFFAAVWATRAGRERLVPVVTLTPAVGGGLLVGAARLTIYGYSDALVVFTFVCLTVAGFTGSWAVVGYVAGTTWRWHRRRDRIGKRELLHSCSALLLGSAATFVSYTIYWTYFVVGLGDAVP